MKTVETGQRPSPSRDAIVWSTHVVTSEPRDDAADKDRGPW
jgi:hypothetical protein